MDTIVRILVNTAYFSAAAGAATVVMIRLYEKGDSPFRPSVYVKSVLAWWFTIGLLVISPLVRGMYGLGLAVVPIIAVAAPAWLHSRVFDIAYLRCVWWIVGSYGILVLSTLGVAIVWGGVRYWLGLS
jgi:hypothetical protein